MNGSVGIQVANVPMSRSTLSRFQSLKITRSANLMQHDGFGSSKVPKRSVGLFDEELQEMVVKKGTEPSGTINRTD